MQQRISNLDSSVNLSILFITLLLSLRPLLFSIKESSSSISQEIRCAIPRGASEPEWLGPYAAMVTIFPDSNKKYLSTDLIRDELVMADHLMLWGLLLSFQALNRVCHLCFDPASAPAP